jgi:hypothetical protein
MVKAVNAGGSKGDCCSISIEEEKDPQDCCESRTKTTEISATD